VSFWSYEISLSLKYSRCFSLVLFKVELLFSKIIFTLARSRWACSSQACLIKTLSMEIYLREVMKVLISLSYHERWRDWKIEFAIKRAAKLLWGNFYNVKLNVCQNLNYENQTLSCYRHVSSSHFNFMHEKSRSKFNLNSVHN
jgi:hypothetical protein